MGIQINRIKAVLAENKRTNRWLAESLGKNEATVSRWCTNETQPSVEVFFQISKLLDYLSQLLRKIYEAKKAEETAQVIG